uniref:Arp2 n=1 Tax=Spiroplasma kunkelii CR2-3x TaxID=273035 RepID=A0SEG2_SPIKU|nr:Arp2 [Spiroplasma kunkelii CR2-3x]
MKKLLSILTITTLTTSIPAPLLAAVPLTNTLTSNSNNEYLSIKEMNGATGITISSQICFAIDNSNTIYFNTDNGIYKLTAGSTTATKINDINDYVRSIDIDSDNNIYFGTNNGAFVLKQGSTTSTKINGISGNVLSIAVDSKDNIYFGTNNGAFVLKQGETTPTKINDINYYVRSIDIDSDNNIYFGTNNGAFVLKQGETTPTKINDINDYVYSIAVDSKDNIYFRTNNGAFVLKQGSTTSTKINGISGNVVSIAVDSKDNIYFGTNNGAFVLKQGSTTSTKINGINDYVLSIAVDSKDNIYFGTDDGIYVLQTALSWLKTQSQFNLVDSTKTQTWTRSDLLSVDGELNIDIVNPNIDKVVFDNVQQGQTSKQWKINVKPETTPRDHNLQVFFTLEGKQYKSEIIVSMQAKINPPTTSKQENLSNVIKFGDDNNLGNIIDNNDNTIEAKIQQLNSRIVDFSQIEITNKDNNKATLTAKPDSKSYIGSVDITYNVVPTTIVDLKIDVIPTSSQATVVKDYLGQIDTSKMTNPVNTFYYTSSESTIKLLKPTSSSVITGIVYGCDEHWNKTSQSNTIDPINGIKLDGSQLATKDGKYIVELSDNLGYTNNVYLQITSKQTISNYFDINNGKQFEQWAEASGYDNIRGYSAIQLNNLFKKSKNWQQLASDSQFATAVAEWFKTNGKLLSTESLTKEKVVEQLKTQIPSDIKIDKVNTNNYDVNKVEFDLNESEFKPNDKGNITVKYGTATSEQFSLQIKNSSSTYNNKGGDSKLWIIGLVVGVLAGLALFGWLFKRFVFDKYFLPKIKKRRHLKLVEQIKKEETEKEAENNKGGDE